MLRPYRTFFHTLWDNIITTAGPLDLFLRVDLLCKNTRYQGVITTVAWMNTCGINTFTVTPWVPGLSVMVH